jgi:hypothetical protein
VGGKIYRGWTAINVLFTERNRSGWERCVDESMKDGNGYVKKNHLKNKK